MLVGIAELEFRLLEVYSLKDKRRLLKGMLERLKHFNVSVAEVGLLDVWNGSIIGVAVVSNSAAHASQMLDSIIAFTEDFHPAVELLTVRREIL